MKYLLLLILVLTGHGGTLTHSYMLDDQLVLFGERGVENKTFAQLFTANQAAGFYRPIGHILLWLSFRLFGHEAVPVGYHLVNLALFVAISFLFFKIICVLTENEDAAFWAAALYALHPLNNMLTNYITASIISVGILGQQLSLLFYLFAIKRGDKASGLSLSFFACAMFSHETSVLFPTYVLIINYFALKKPTKESAVLCAPYFLMSLVYILFRISFFPLHDPHQPVIHPGAGQLGTYFVAGWQLLGWYVSKLLLPFQTLFLWSSPLSYHVFQTPGGLTVGLEPDAGAAVAAWLAVSISLYLLLAYFLFFRRKRGARTAALLIFITGLLPAFCMMFVHFPYAAPFIEPHWFYFSSIGFFWLAGNLMATLKDKVGMKAWGTIIIAVLSSYLILLNISNSQWRTEETYCRYWLSLNQNDATPFFGLARSLLKGGDYDGAVEYFNKGIAAAHYYNPLVFADLGYAYFLKGDRTAAMANFDRALRMDPRNSLLHHYLGEYHIAKKQWALAEKDYIIALELFPSNMDYERYLSSVRQKLKE